MIPKRGHTITNAPAAGPCQPKLEVLLENNNLRLSANDSKVFLADDGAPPSNELVQAAKRNSDLFNK